MTSLYDLFEFEKCINIAKNSLESGNFEKAERFALKADRMHPSSNAVAKILSKIRANNTQDPTNNNFNNVLKRRQKPEYVNFSSDVINKGEAVKCLDLAENALLSGNLEKAERLALKANRMCSTQRAEDILNRIKNGDSGNTWNRRSVKTPRPFSNIYNQGTPKSISSKEDAEKCIDVAQTVFNAGDYDKAERFLEKAQRLYHTARARDLLQQISDARKRNPSGHRTFETPSVERPRSTTHGAIPPRESPKEERKQRPLFTPEQLEAIRRVRSAKNDYDILGKLTNFFYLSFTFL